MSNRTISVEITVKPNSTIIAIERSLRAVIDPLSDHEADRVASFAKQQIQRALTTPILEESS